MKDKKFKDGEQEKQNQIEFLNLSVIFSAL